MKQSRRICSILMALILCLSLLPTAAFAAEPQQTVTGISANSNETLEDMGFKTYSDQLRKQAADKASPYGNGYSTLVPFHELLALSGKKGGGANMLYNYDQNFSKAPKATEDYSALKGAGEKVVGMRSVAFDPLGVGKDNFTATVTAEIINGYTYIHLSIGPDNNTRKELANKAKHPLLFQSFSLAFLPFEVQPENAGAYLSIDAGNFNGDDKGIDELAVYRPFFSYYNGWSKEGDRANGIVDILGLKVEDKQPKELVISTAVKNSYYAILNWILGKEQKSQDSMRTVYEMVHINHYELIDKSTYYFYDNSGYYKMENEPPQSDYWKYMYRIPQVGVETVSQPGNTADDLCITYSPAMGGKKTKDTDVDGMIDINAKRPYDSATSVFFWIDPATKNDKATGVTQMRWNWQKDYGVPKELDGKANNKMEVMTFGGAGSGDVNGDGYSEVVVAGYRFKNTNETYDGSDNGDWDFAEKEYLATYFTYDPAKNTYKHCGSPANWVSANKDDYADSYDQLDGMYHNIGDKDSIHTPLAVECFADRGKDYAEAVAVGGIIAYLDAESGVSTCRPDQKKFAGSAFDAGTFNGLYAIPIKGIQKEEFGDEDITNRFFVDLVAGNYDGNLLGKEYLAFAYTAKKEGKSSYYSAHGIIGQVDVGEQGTARNTKRKDDNWDKKHYMDKGLELKLYSNTNSEERTYAPISIAAVDPDNDSIIMRRTNKPNDYFFSDPEIIAVLQAAPYFKEVDYGADAGETTYTTTQGTSVEETHGVYAALNVKVGFEIEDVMSITAGVSTDFANSWGDGSSKSFSLAFSSATEDSVALVMVPCVRYYYEVWNPNVKNPKWEPMEVDSSQTPRASIITVEAYDKVAKDQGWGLIRGNILPDNDNNPNTPYVYGDPRAYYDSESDIASRAVYDKDNKTYFHGATTAGYGHLDDKKDKNYGADDYVKLGVSNGSTITQSLSYEATESTIREWQVGAVTEDDFEIGSVVLEIGAELGYTGSKTWVDMMGQEYSGSVMSVPNGHEAYSFAWRFGYWTDELVTSADGTKQKFPVLGYLVKEVISPVPPIEDPLLHVKHSDTNTVTLAWKANQGGVNINTPNDGYLLCRLRHGVYYPIGMFSLSNAKNGWFVFTDRYTDAFTEYAYALRPYALTGGDLLYGDYISKVEGYTITDRDNIPRVTVSDAGLSGGQRTLKAHITPATGNVGLITNQWQHYEPENGGWQDLPDGIDMGTITIPAKEDSTLYRCRVTQRVGTEIITVYSGAAPSGYVFVAGKSSAYTDANDRTVVEYTLVHENGEVTIATSENTKYNPNFVYSQSYDAEGNLLLLLNEHVKQHRSVTDIDGERVEVDGGEKWADDSGHAFNVTQTSKVWDVELLVKRVGANIRLRDGTSPEDAVKKLPGVTACKLAMDDWLSYSFNNGDLRAAFVRGTKAWVEPSEDEPEEEDLEFPDYSHLTIAELEIELSIVRGMLEDLEAEPWAPGTPEYRDWIYSMARLEQEISQLLAEIAKRG